MVRLWIFAAAALFSTGGAAIKANSLTAWQVASFRSLIAAITISLLIPTARRNWSWRYAGPAVAYAGTLITFVLATKLTTSANAIFLQCTAPLYLVVLSPWLLREHLRRSDYLLLLSAGFGMLLFFLSTEPARATAPDPVTGNMIAVLSGLAWALTLLGLRSVARGDNSEHAGMPTVVIGNYLTFAITLGPALPVESFRAADLLVILYLGIAQIGLAYLCLTRGIRKLPAFEAATLLLIEPALNPVLTWLLLREAPAPLSIAGGVIIVGTTLLNTWWQSRSEALTRVHPSGAASRSS